MDIKRLIEAYHNGTEEKRNQIEETIKKEFSSLSEFEKKEVRNKFLDGLEKKLDEAGSFINETKKELEGEQIATYAPVAAPRSA